MSNTTISPQQGNEKFLQKLEDRGVDVQACYQCGRCSAGCPITEFFDLTTMEVVRLAAYGMEERLLEYSVRIIKNDILEETDELRSSLRVSKLLKRNRNNRSRFDIGYLQTNNSSFAPLNGCETANRKV